MSARTNPQVASTPTRLAAAALALLAISGCGGDFRPSPRLSGGGSISPLTDDSERSESPVASADGRWVAYGKREDKATRLILTDTHTGKERVTTTSLSDYPISMNSQASCVAFTSPDKAGADHSWLWDLANDKSAPIGPTTGSWEPDVSGDCQSVVFRAFKRGLQLLDRTNNSLITVAPESAEPAFHRISRDGRWVVYAELGSNKVKLWNRGTSTSATLPVEGASSLGISENGNIVLIGRSGKSAVVFDRTTKKLTHSPHAYTSVSLSADGSTVFGAVDVPGNVASEHDNRSRIEQWDLASTQVTVVTNDESAISGWSPYAVSSSQVVFSGDDMTLPEPRPIRIWRWQSRD